MGGSQRAWFAQRHNGTMAAGKPAQASPNRDPRLLLFGHRSGSRQRGRPQSVGREAAFTSPSQLPSSRHRSGGSGRSRSGVKSSNSGAAAKVDGPSAAALRRIEKCITDQGSAWTDRLQELEALHGLARQGCNELRGALLDGHAMASAPAAAGAHGGGNTIAYGLELQLRERRPAILKVRCVRNSPTGP